MSETAPMLVGHDAAMREVETAFRSGRMPHAWLLAGIEGIGKATLAKHIASFVLANGQGELGHLPPDHPVVKLVEADSHPDMLVIRRPMDEKTGLQRGLIPVEEVLRIATFLHKTATHGGWRVVVVDEAHTLNRNGQNAILKIVEEPPPRTLILITVTTPGALLPTIRSRSRVLHLSPLSLDPLRAVIHALSADAPRADIDAAAELAGGSVGFAMKILRTESLAMYQEMLGIFDGLPQLDIARLHKLADQIGRKADSDSFDVLSTLLVERLRRAAQEEAHKASGHANLAVSLWEKTRETLAACENGNLDRKLAFITAITHIRAAMA